MVQIVYASQTDVMIGNLRPAYTGVAQIRQGQTTELDLPVTP
jgi:hypothetical protein